MPEDTIEEIVLRERRRGRGILDSLLAFLGDPEFGDLTQVLDPLDIDPTLTLVSPGLAPAVEKAITTVPRPTAAPVRPPSVGPAVGSIAIVAAIGAGAIIKEFLDELGSRKLNEAWRAFENVRTKPDSPLRTDRRLEPLPNVIVTGKRITALHQLPPLPQFIPEETDPFRMVPIVPRFFPEPGTEVIPDIEVLPFEIPQPAPSRVPARSPRTRPAIFPLGLPSPLASPQRFAQPFADPFADPFANPLAQPQPQLQPQPQPSVGPLTAVGPTMVVSPATAPFPQPFAQPAGLSNCPPCPKEADTQKVRDQCWKKLVKEGITADLDETFNWVEIDCISGREL